MTELTIDQALQQAIEAHKAGQVQKADRLYTAILKAQPKHPDANHNMGVLAVGVEKVEQALPYFKTALEANPNTAQFLLSYIDALIKLDKLADAKAVFDQAKSKGAKGDGFDKLERRLKEAGESRALDIAVQLRDSGEFNQAIDLLKDETNKFPENADILALLSHCYLLADQVSEAKLYLDQATEIAPNNALVGWNTVRLKLKEQKPVEALNIARTTNLRFPDDVEGMEVLGACLRVNGEFDKSLKILNRAIEFRPDYAEALVNRGLIRLSQKNQSKALADLELAHEFKPHIKQIWDLVISLKMETQNYSDTIVLLIKMIEIDPENEKRVATLALCYHHLKDFDSAINAYKRVLAFDPDCAEAYNNMGAVLKEQGKLEEAIEAYKKALAAKSEYADAHNNMGVTLKEQGKLKDAIEAYKKALAIKPDYAEVYYNMGVTLKVQGELEEAIEAYKKALAFEPNYAEAAESFLDLQTQIKGANLSDNMFILQANENSKLDIKQRPKLHIIKAINSFLSAERNQALRHIQNFRACDPKSSSNLNSKEKVFCSAYGYYLSALLKEQSEATPNLQTGNVIYHIGESHCLSYAHCNIKIKGQTFHISPMITFGAKAFHFAKTRNNGYKAITKANLVSIRQGSKVFISFGEIDCRPNEGFISAASKLDKPIDGLISSTVKGYLKWLAEQNKTLHHRIYLLNVAAPMYSKNYSLDVNAEVANVVNLFNAEIKKQIVQYELSLIDVYRFTLGQDGFSNGQFHIDGKHLGAKAISEIEQQLHS